MQTILWSSDHSHLTLKTKRADDVTKLIEIARKIASVWSRAGGCVAVVYRCKTQLNSVWS